ncbi:MAG: hypothetical protein JRN21_03770 [Nitrososphaerota archaeon]|nr:hypothetical protein [Nitrososphaerota archaeon]
MSTKGRFEDISTLLYMAPFLVSGLYGLFLWARGGLSALLPNAVFLQITRSPYVFVVGTLCVMVGLAVEMRGTPLPARREKLASLASTLLAIAGTSLFFALAAGLYANGLGLGGTASDLIVGRYDLVFPVVMVVLSLLLTSQFRWSALSDRNVLAIIALFLVPASLYEVGKRQTALGLGLAFILMVAGLAAILMPTRDQAAAKEQVAEEEE